MYGDDTLKSYCFTLYLQIHLYIGTKLDTNLHRFCIMCYRLKCRTILNWPIRFSDFLIELRYIWGSSDIAHICNFSLTISSGKINIFFITLDKSEK